MVLTLIFTMPMISLNTSSLISDSITMTMLTFSAAFSAKIGKMEADSEDLDSPASTMTISFQKALAKGSEVVLVRVHFQALPLVVQEEYQSQQAQSQKQCKYC